MVPDRCNQTCQFSLRGVSATPSRANFIQTKFLFLAVLRKGIWHRNFILVLKCDGVPSTHSFISFSSQSGNLLSPLREKEKYELQTKYEDRF